MVCTLAHLLKSGECAEPQVLLDAVGPQDDRGGEIRGLGDVTGHVGALHHSLLAGHALDQGVSEPANKKRNILTESMSDEAWEIERKKTENILQVAIVHGPMGSLPRTHIYTTQVSKLNAVSAF
jgi:hypothetical protein